MNLKAVIFDLDGTLGNTLPLCIEAFRRAIEPLAGRSMSDADIIATFGPTEEGTINAIVSEHYDRGLAAYLENYAALHDMCPAPFEGIMPILDWLRSKGIALGMVTGKGRVSCDISLERFGLAGYFGIVETGSPLGQVKTEGIRAVLDHFGVDPAEAIYVGDAPSDITSSASAGVRAVAAAWAATADIEVLRGLEPYKLFTSIKEFENYLKQTID